MGFQLVYYNFEVWKSENRGPNDYLTIKLILILFIQAVLWSTSTTYQMRNPQNWFIIGTLSPLLFIIFYEVGLKAETLPYNN